MNREENPVGVTIGALPPPPNFSFEDYWRVFMENFEDTTLVRQDGRMESGIVELAELFDGVNIVTNMFS